MPDLSVVLNHWKELTLGAAVVALFFGDKLGNLVKGIKLPNFGSSSKKVENSKKKDLAAIDHLRSRAVEVDDKVLLQEIKSVASKFFDIHSNSANNNNG